MSYLKGVFGSFWPKPLSSSTSATEGEGENQGQGQGENQVDSVESQEEKQGEASMFTLSIPLFFLGMQVIQEQLPF